MTGENIDKVSAVRVSDHSARLPSSKLSPISYQPWRWGDGLARFSLDDVSLIWVLSDHLKTSMNPWVDPSGLPHVHWYLHSCSSRIHQFSKTDCSPGFSTSKKHTRSTETHLWNSGYYLNFLFILKWDEVWRHELQLFLNVVAGRGKREPIRAFIAHSSIIHSPKSLSQTNTSSPRYPANFFFCWVSFINTGPRNSLSTF